MYAVIESGSKQYLVRRGDIIDVELRPVEGKKVKKVVFDKVLLIRGEGGSTIGTPYVANSRVVGEVLAEVKDRKVIVFKKKRRKGYKKKQGHRQRYLRVKITAIE